MESISNVYSQKVTAGKRTYFADVKETRNGSYYLVVSESRKSYNEEGIPSFQKSKIFVYPEDLNRFSKAVENTVNHIKELMPGYDFTKFERRDEERSSEEDNS